MACSLSKPNHKSDTTSHKVLTLVTRSADTEDYIRGLQRESASLAPEEGVMPKACAEYHLLDYKLVSNSYILLLTSVQRPDRLRHGVHNILHILQFGSRAGTRISGTECISVQELEPNQSLHGHGVHSDKENKRKGTECSNLYYYDKNIWRRILL